MAANAIDNTNLINYCRNCSTGFVPALSYTYNAGTGVVVVTNSSTIPAGDALTKVHVRVHDQFGKQANATIYVTDDPQVATVNVNTAGLNTSKPLRITATVLTAGQLAADGSAWDIQAAGNISRWDVQSNA